MSYLVPSEFVTKMIDAGESKIFMSTRDTLVRSYMAGAILALAAWFAVTINVEPALPRQMIKRKQTAGRRLVMSGPKGLPRIDLQADGMGAAIGHGMCAGDIKPPCRDCGQFLQRFTDPVAVGDGAHGQFGLRHLETVDQRREKMGYSPGFGRLRKKCAHPEIRAAGNLECGD